MFHQIYEKTQSWFKSVPDDVLAGAFAGFVARMLTAPLDVLKIRYQLNKNNIAQSPSLWNAVKTIVLEEGVTALWKGNVPGLYLWISYSIFQFAFYDIFKSMERVGEEEEGSKQSPSTTTMRRAGNFFLAGALASTLATVLTYPFDVTRTQFALQGKEKAFSSMSSFATHAIKNRGVSGLFSGLGPAVLIVTPQMGLNFALYESLKSALPDGDYSSQHAWIRTLKKGALGGLAGGASKLLVYPLDTVKKRLQAYALDGSTKSMMSCVRLVYEQDGFLGFYRGMQPTAAKAVAASAITFAAFEGARDLLRQRRKTKSRREEQFSLTKEESKF
eukprot:gene2110-2304_t